MELLDVLLYLSSLRVFQPLGTVHIQEEVLQQGLCFLQIPGILWLELKSLVLLVIAGVLPEPGLCLQDVPLNLVSICLHAGDEHGQLVR